MITKFLQLLANSITKKILNKVAKFEKQHVAF